MRNDRQDTTEQAAEDDRQDTPEQAAEDDRQDTTEQAAEDVAAAETAFGEPGEIQAVEQGKDGEVESRAGGQKPAQWHEYGEEDPVEYPPGTFPGVRTPAMNWGQGQGVQVDRPSMNHVSGVLGIVLGLSALVPCYVTPPVQSLHSPALGDKLPAVSGAFSS